MNRVRNDILKNDLGRVLVMGVGATGSHFVVELVKLGAQEIVVVDPGVVKEHNLTNQAYSMGMVGMNKAEAIKGLCAVRYGYEDIIIWDDVLGDIGEFDLVLNCIDSPKARETMRHRVKNSNAKYIETAFDVYSSDVFVSHTANFDSEISKIISRVGNDENGTSEVTSACGSRLSVSASINMVVGFTVWKIIKWINKGEVRTGQYTLHIDGNCFYQQLEEIELEEVHIEEA